METGMLHGLQVPLGLLDPQAGDHVVPRAAAQGIPVIVRGVFAGGFVARPLGDDRGQLRPGQPARLAAIRDLASSVGVSALQLAVWFVARPDVSTVLIGTSSGAHLSEVASYFQIPPPDQMLKRLTELPAETAGLDQ
jgi:aryl-alcohol dehydrogenase-like predicted oxidoreductase